MEREKLSQLLEKLNHRMAEKDLTGELLICGGALMTLVYDRNRMTEDIDGIFQPKEDIQLLIDEIAKEEGLPQNWINDQVHEYLNLTSMDSDLIFQYSHFAVKGVALPVLLGMKLMASRAAKDMGDIHELVIRRGLFDWNQLIDELGAYVPKERLKLAPFILNNLFHDIPEETRIRQHYEKQFNDQNLLNEICQFTRDYTYPQCLPLDEILNYPYQNEATHGQILHIRSLIESV